VKKWETLGVHGTRLLYFVRGDGKEHGIDDKIIASMYSAYDTFRNSAEAPATILLTGDGNNNSNLSDTGPQWVS
jgi:hypothetical protein